MSCHALGTIGTRTIPKELGEFKNSTEAWAAAHPVRTGDDPDGQRRRPTRCRSARSTCGPIGPIASPPASCRSRKPERPQGIERNVVLTLWDWSRPTAYLHDLIGDRPAQADALRQRQALRLAGRKHGLRADPRSGDAYGDRGEASGARSEDAVLARTTRWRRRPTGEPSRSGTARPAITTR